MSYASLTLIYTNFYFRLGEPRIHFFRDADFAASLVLRGSYMCNLQLPTTLAYNSRTALLHTKDELN